MAWRSWNAFLADIDDGLIRQNIEAMVAKTGVPGRPGSPGPSLWDAGFRSVGIDEGWEGCGLGAHGTQHDALGNPTVVRRATPFACDFSSPPPPRPHSLTRQVLAEHQEVPEHFEAGRVRPQQASEDGLL